MRTRRVAVLLVAAAAVVGIGWFVARSQSGIDFERSPQTVYTTDPLAVGATYTMGSVHVPPDVKRPVTITSVEIIATRGIEVLGTGAFESGLESLGLVLDWPPPGYPPVEPLAGRRAWSGLVDVVIGIRVTERRSGFRGIDLRWIDGDGKAGRRLHDWAVVTCSPGECPDDGDSDALLVELGLMR